MTTKTIERAALSAFITEAFAALEPVAKRHGLAITGRRGTYGGPTGSLRFELAVIDTGGTAYDRDAEAFKVAAAAWDLKPGDLGRAVFIGGKSYTISGLNPTAPKYPVLAKAANGKTYKFTTGTVLKALGRPAAPPV